MKSGTPVSPVSGRAAENRQNSFARGVVGRVGNIEVVVDEVLFNVQLLDKGEDLGSPGPARHPSSVRRTGEWIIREPPGRQLLVRVVMQVQRKSQLLEVVRTRRTPGSFAGGLHRRQE